MVASVPARAPPTWPISPSPLTTTVISPPAAAARASRQPCSSPSVNTARCSSPAALIAASIRGSSSRARPPPADGLTSSR